MTRSNSCLGHFLFSLFEANDRVCLLEMTKLIFNEDPSIWQLGKTSSALSHRMLQ